MRALSPSQGLSCQEPKKSYEQQSLEFLKVTDLSSRYRHLFPVLEKVTYLNSCSQGALAIPVREALDLYLDGMFEKGSLWNEWVMKQEELRVLVAKAFSTLSTNVAITSTASAGINSVLSSFDFTGGRNRIVTTDLEFPTMGQILHAQERRGAVVTHIASEPNGLLDLNKLENSLDERVALIAVTHVCYRHGAMTDLKAVATVAHKHGIPVLVDAYQSCGSQPIDFDEVGVDFLVGGFLKYMLGIPGIGFLLARSDSTLVPTKTGWFAARDIFSMDINSYDPSPEARRFEGGTPPIPSVYAAVAGLQVLLEVGLRDIWDYTKELSESIRLRLDELGFEIATPEAPGSSGLMLAVRALKPELSVLQLEADGVIVSTRGDNLRVSPHFYNSIEDADRLVSSLFSHRESFM
jgi:selenocysteine lyase/cysteine desulfurase